MLQTLWQIDRSIFYFFNHTLGNFILDPFMLLISEDAFWFFGMTLTCILSLSKYWKHLRPWLIGGFIAMACTDFVAFRVLKPYFHRYRPCYTMIGEVRLVPESCGGNFSFPSNHAANGAALTGVAILTMRRKFTIALGIVSLLVGCSRIYLGVHYPSDVFFGWGLGFIVGFFVSVGIRRNPLVKTK